MGVDKTTIPAEFMWWKKKETTWDSPYRLNWNVKYEPGELKVIAYKGGKEVAEKTIVTAGAPHHIALSPDRTAIDADGNDLSFITVKIVDKDGDFCPTADNLVNFSIDGPATIAAVGNGNAATTEPFQANYRKAFNGLCMLIIKSKAGVPGQIEIKASSKGLQEKNYLCKKLINMQTLKLLSLVGLMILTSCANSQEKKTKCHPIFSGRFGLDRFRELRK